MNEQTLGYMLKEKNKKPPVTRSTVMFHGDYKRELEKLLDVVDSAIENGLPEHLVVDSILGGNNNLKVRLEDTEHGVERIVNCMFRHHHTDERYGNIHIDLVTNGHGLKSELTSIGKFSIVDHATIREKILRGIVSCVKKTYYR